MAASDSGDEMRPAERAAAKAPDAPPGWVGYAGAGFEFVAAILLPGALGWWLDRKFGSAPWIMLAGGLLGFMAGLRILMRSVTKPKR
jgi:ATP synthase protein I